MRRRWSRAGPITPPAWVERFSGTFSHYDGLVLIIIGMAIIVLSLIRFIRTGRLIDDQQMHLIELNGRLNHQALRSIASADIDLG